ncbi:MAG: hypothetical protein HQK55_15225 [Deltaproteobacteria bacterium]|nr:hypothetical protein [Deltaproteobacteria bacterium]
MAFKFDHTFDDKTYHQYIDGFESVMHCHHYLTLTIQLAEEMAAYGGTRILAESVEDSIRPLLDAYVQEHNLPAGEERLKMGAEYYCFMGMGLMEAKGNAQDGEVILTRSHVDQGWITKFGPVDRSLNYFTCGYIAAMFGCAFDRPTRSYTVKETSSLVKGDKLSRFAVQAN